MAPLVSVFYKRQPSKLHSPRLSSSLSISQQNNCVSESNSNIEHSYLNLNSQQLEDNSLGYEQLPSMKAQIVCFGKNQSVSKEYQIPLQNILDSFSKVIQITCIQKLARTYYDLVNKYGLFILNKNMIGFNQDSQMSIKIDTFLIQTIESEMQACLLFLEMVKKYLSLRVYNLAPTDKLEKLVDYFQKLNKRSKIHKKCHQVMMNRTQTKISKYQSLTASNLSKHRLSVKQISPDTSCISGHSELWKNRHKLNNRKESNKQVSAFILYDQSSEIARESYQFCDIGPKLQNIQKYEAVQFNNKENRNTRNVCQKYDLLKDNKSQSKILKEVSNCHILESRRNSLEASFKQLFLSQISQDSQQQKYDSKKNFEQLVNDFENVFY